MAAAAALIGLLIVIAAIISSPAHKRVERLTALPTGGAVAGEQLLRLADAELVARILRHRR